MMMRPGYIWCATATLALWVGCGAAGADDAAAGPPEHRVGSPAPLALDPDAPVSREHAQPTWDAGVYPIGNGRLACILDGGMARERISFYAEAPPAAAEEGAERYRDFGELHVVQRNLDGATPEACDYRRELDLSRGVHTTTFEWGGIDYRREAFASRPAGVVVLRYTAGMGAALHGAITMVDAHPDGVRIVAGDRVSLSGQRQTDAMYLPYEAQAVILHKGGTLRATTNSLVFTACDSLTILLDADEGSAHAHPRGRVASRLAAAAARPYEALRDEHVADHQARFKRNVLRVPGATDFEAAPAP